MPFPVFLLFLEICTLISTKLHYVDWFDIRDLWRHTIRSAVVYSPMLHAQFTALCFIEMELLPKQVLHCWNRDFRPFCSCDLDVDPMTFIYERNPYSLETYRMCENELPTSSVLKVISWNTLSQKTCWRIFAITSSNVNRFWEFFHRWKQQ